MVRSIAKSVLIALEIRMDSDRFRWQEKQLPPLWCTMPFDEITSDIRPTKVKISLLILR